MSDTPRIAPLVARRVPEHGWALFDKATGEKVDPAAPNAWWPTRRHALRRKEVVA